MEVRFVRFGVLVAAYGIVGHLREQLKMALEYYRLVSEIVMGKPITKAIPARMWSERPDGSMLFYAGYLSKVCGILQANGITTWGYERLDRKEKLVPDLTHVQLEKMRPEQLRMLEAIVGWDSGQVIAPTGVGKSVFCGELCALYPQARIVLAAPTIDTVATLMRYLSERLGEPVGQVGGGKKRSQRVTVSTYDSIQAVSGIDKCDILVVDEAHRAGAEDHAKRFAAVHFPEKRFGLTATAGDMRSDKAGWLVEGLFGPVILEISYQEAIASGSVVPLELVVHENQRGPSQATAQACRTQADKDRLAVWTNHERNRLIAEDVEKMRKLLGEPQTLVLVDRLEHLLALKQFLPDYEVAYGKLQKKQIARLNRRHGHALTSEDDISIKERDVIRKRFETGEARKVLATSVFATGVSSNSCGLVAFASGSGAPIAFIQSLGRGSRTDASTGKEYAVCLMWEDTFNYTYKARSRKLIAAAAKAEHHITRIPASVGVETWTPPN